MYTAAAFIRSLPLVALGVVSATPLHSVAATCEPDLSDRPAVHEALHELKGDGTANQSVQLPAHTTVVVVASEDGVDVALQVSAAERLMGRADNPIRRTGNQRVVFATGAESEYQILVRGKEQGEQTGRVRLRVVAFGPAEANDPCLAVQQLLAAADAAYAAGQQVTRHLETDSKLDAPGSYRLAAKQYRAAAQRLGELTPSKLLAQAQLAEAAAQYYDLADYSTANLRAAEAESTFAAVRDEYGRARAQAIVATSLMELALRPQVSGADTTLSASVTLERARAMLAALATFHTARGEHYDAALALNNIGLTYYLEGRYDQALAAYRRALALYQRLHERPRQALALQNIALVEYELGRFSDAAPRYAQALRLVSQQDSPRLYPMLLNNSALANWASGQYDAALRQYGEALRLVRETQDAAAEASILQNIGYVYYSAGDEPFALEISNEALKLSSVERDPALRTVLLRGIGNMLRERGRFADALRMHEEALALASNPTVKDQVVIQIARDLAALDRTAEALQRLSLVLDRRVAGNDFVRARALLERGRLRILTGELRGAAADVHHALRTFQTYDLPQDLFDAWLVLARLKRRSGATDAAFDALNKALALAEELRLQTANPELRATRLQPLRAAFELKISMLADRYFAGAADAASRQGIAVEALATAEQARARALEDFRNLDPTAPGLPPDLIQKRRQIYKELAARRYRLEMTLDHATADDAHVAIIRTDIADLRRALDQIDARIGAGSTVTSRRTAGPRAMSVSIGALPADAAVVEYWLGEDVAIAWTATAEGVTMARLGAAPGLNHAAREFLTALRSFGTVPLQARLRLAEELSARVLDPIAAQVTGKRILLFAPDGALHYVPFAALRLRESGRARFLIEGHDVAVIPSVNTLAAGDDDKSRLQPARQMLLVADPVYARDDARFATGAAADGRGKPDAKGSLLTLMRGGADVGQLSRLPGTAREAAAIAALLPRGSVDRLEGFAATRERFLGSSLGSYRYIHVASHAVADTEVPQASALILSTLDDRSREIDGRVLAADFMTVRLNADAVVLSACGTALGKDVAGEGLLGLEYVVLARGAKSVVASLWPVADRPAAELMGHFYSSLVGSGSSVLSALGDAMRAQLATASADPSHWAAFMLTISTLQ